MKLNRDELVAGGVALAAFACSAAHIYSVAEAQGNPWFIAALHPIGLDGLIFVGLRNLKRAPAAGWIAAGYGAVMSLAFNGASYAETEMPWWLMAATMPLAMVLGFVVIHAGHRDRPADVPAVPVPRARPVRVPATVPPADVPASVPVPAVPTLTVVPAVPSSRSRKAWDKDKARTLLAEGRPRREIADLCGVDRKSIDRLAQAVGM
jgi:hypothetical protein